ncbi:MAG: hypothetical protein AB7E77_12745, partial [Desulfobulbus sp.]
AYLTSASPEGGVLNSLGLIIIGAFRFVQWAFAMVIGLAVCIAVLIAIFLFAVALVNKETAATMYGAVKVGVAELLRPAFAFIASLQCKDDKSCALLAAPDASELKDEMQSIINGEVQKVSDSQQSLNEQFATLNRKIEALEAKSGDFVAAAQVETIAGEIAASGQSLNTVQGQVAALEGKLNDTVAKLDGLGADKILGDLPARLEKLEQQDTTFDPKPLTEAIETSKNEVQGQVAALEGKLNDTVAKLDGLGADKILGDLPARLEKLEQQDATFDPKPLTEAIETSKNEVQGQVAALEGKLNDTVAKLDGLDADKILGDLPARLEKLEQQEQPENTFDLQPLTEAIETLKKEMEEVKKKTTKPPARTSTRSRKKA